MKIAIIFLTCISITVSETEGTYKLTKVIGGDLPKQSYDNKNQVILEKLKVSLQE